MIKILYQELIQKIINKHFSVLLRGIIENQDLFNKEIKKYLNNEVEKIILPTLCWQLYLDKSKGSILGKNTRERFKNFIFSKKETFLKNFPSLYKLIKKILEEDVLFLFDSLEKFLNNKNLISDFFKVKFKKIKYIKIPTQSDRHTKGRRVIFFILDNQKIIKYNPHQFSKAKSFIEIINRFNKENEIQLKIPKSLETKDGWYSEFIQTKNKNISFLQAKKFYYQLGQILALIYSLNGSDFHMENLIASKEKPIILDFESLFTNFSFYKNKKIENSLESTGIIEKRKSKQLTSAIFGGNKKIISLANPIILFKNTDLMRIKYRTYSKIKLENRIFKKNRKLWKPESFKNEMIKGFKDSYLWIEKNKEKIYKIIDSYQDTLTRVIVRRTSLYTLIEQNLIQPFNLQLNKFKRKIKKILQENSKKNHLISNKNLEKIISYETKEIASYSIPIFWQNIRKKDLFFEKGKIKNFFPKSAIELLISKLEKINKKNLESKIRYLKNF